MLQHGLHFFLFFFLFFTDIVFFEISEILVREIVDGIGDSGIRCGIIGEVGCSSPLTDCERKSLQAAAIAQQKTGNSQ